MPVSLQLLTQFPLLRTLQREALEPLSQRMSLHEFARRAMVMSREAPRRLWDFWSKVAFRVWTSRSMVAAWGCILWSRGDYFGELSLVDGQPPSEYVVAASKSTVALLDAATARDLITRHPELAQAVMKRLAERVRSVLAQRTLLSLPNPFQRLCALLLQLPQRQAGGVTEVDQAPTHQELAIMINASRETVTRAFQVLFLRGILVREGNSLKLVNPQVLQNIAQGREEPLEAEPVMHNTTLLDYLLPLRHAGLLRQLWARDVQQRYRQSWLGLMWIVLTPLAMLAVYTLVFRHVMRVRWPGVGEPASGMGGDLAFALGIYAGLAVFLSLPSASTGPLRWCWSNPIW